ncbi:MAG: putative Competence protein ComEC/Rec2 related protein [Nitrospira sp.]|jgi:competence protein ComEC|nr:putative Competence protein ComEC/Rec2 related protein [Nitrospira sp.]
MLPSLTITFIAGLLFGSCLSYFPFTIAVILIAAAGVLTFLETQGAVSLRQSLTLLACLLGGCLYWTLFAWFSPHVPLPAAAGTFPVRLEGTIVESVHHAPERLTALVKVAVIDDTALETPLQLRLTWRNPDRDLRRGLRIRTRTRLHEPLGTVNPRGFDYAAHLEAQDVDAVGSVSGSGAIEVLSPDQERVFHSFTQRIEAWRAWVRSGAESIPQPSRGLFLSLTIGEQGYLAPEVREWFMTTGTVHILSISGSHLGLIALLSFAVVRKLCLLLPAMWLLSLSRWLTATRLAAILSLFPVAAYTLLAGAETATIRSFIMITVALWTVWLGAPHYILHALAAAAGMTLFAHPPALYDISFELSYVSVLVLALAIERDRRRVEPDEQELSAIGRTVYWMGQSVRLTALVSLATLPLVALYFNQISWLGLFVNLLVVPYVGFVLLPISLLSVVWVIVTRDSTLSGAALIDSLGQGLISATHALAGLPGGEWFVAAPTLPMIVLFYLLGWALVTGAPTHATPLLKSALMMGILCIMAWWLWSPRPFSKDEQARVTFLDVGQGDSTVIELPSGTVMLIDGGATYERFDMGRSVVAPFLWNRGIRRIDHVIGTHPQLDHVGGLAWILAHFEVEKFWTNGVTRTEDFWRKIEAALTLRHLQTTVAVEGQFISAGEGCRMSILNPRAPRGTPAAAKNESLNNLSVVTELHCMGRRMLFTGDLEREALARLTRSGMFAHVALLKVPHHGARSSLEHNWLDTIRPDIAVVSAGRRNPYGHPAADVLAAYRSTGTQVLRTDQDGAVWVDLDLRQQRLSVHSTRDWMLHPVNSGQNMWAIERDNFRRLWRRWNWN